MNKERLAAQLIALAERVESLPDEIDEEEIQLVETELTDMLRSVSVDGIE